MDLKPCPHCGSAPELTPANPTGMPDPWVSCPALIPVGDDLVSCGDYRHSPEGWNTRADESPTAPRFTFAQPYPGGRILLMLGQHQAGAVFPPVGDPPDRLPWVWRFWLATGTTCPEGRAKTEHAAKNAILAQATDWLRKAGLVE